MADNPLANLGSKADTGEKGGSNPESERVGFRERARETLRFLSAASRTTPDSFNRKEARNARRLTIGSTAFEAAQLIKPPAAGA